MKMKDLGVNRYADIIIVDGGSTDNSLVTQNLLDLGVHTLIVKKDVGRLSAQLRCAYAFALDNKYRNIVTIDGNNKNDPEAIPTFLKKLYEGFDFVQASRFLPGGYEENTPWIRSLAVQWIHAPFLSASSGFKWTDTTQGFRAYSSKLLSSSKVNIFRDDFKDYELLAYLNHISPRLGFSCVEIPTKRIYPKGKVPTKISSFRGNLRLFKTLLEVCSGNFDSI